MVVEPNFLSFFGMRMESGEWLSENEIPQYVINQTGAEMINLPADFSKIYDIPEAGGAQFHISGILKDYHYFPIQYPLEKTFFHIPSERERANLLLKTPYIYIKIIPENKDRALTFAKQHYKDFSKGEVTPEKQFQYLPDIMRELNVADIYMSRIFLTLALICILISSLGIYLLVALSTEQRKKEMAIHIINGAAFIDILKLFLDRYLVLALMANALSLPLGYLFVHRWLQTYAYHFQLSFLMFVLVLLITIMIVILSVAIQVTRVLKMNPAEVVKSE
ncbi:ABC transporter permease [Proteiniphilum acetatigenes]|uniref:ABC transporter permease n=1 Tax=Proteiniphilum acetatigenes TaxID=294710 RepID=UPI00037CB976|nr:ABC transporter permease [Proteiniphilum acetatigenes]